MRATALLSSSLLKERILHSSRVCIGCLCHLPCGAHGTMGAARFLHLSFLRRLHLALLRPALTPSTHQEQRMRPKATRQYAGRSQTSPPQQRVLCLISKRMPRLGRISIVRPLVLLLSRLRAWRERCLQMKRTRATDEVYRNSKDTTFQQIHCPSPGKVRLIATVCISRLEYRTLKLAHN